MRFFAIFCETRTERSVEVYKGRNLHPIATKTSQTVTDGATKPSQTVTDDSLCSFVTPSVMVCSASCSLVHVKSIVLDDIEDKMNKIKYNRKIENFQIKYNIFLILAHNIFYLIYVSESDSRT